MGLMADLWKMKLASSEEPKHNEESSPSVEESLTTLKNEITGARSESLGVRGEIPGVRNDIQSVMMRRRGCVPLRVRIYSSSDIESDLGPSRYVCIK